MNQKSNTKQEILDASLEFFSTQGYEATSISQIAKAVGIRKSSLYSHFASKQDILTALCENVLVEFNEHSIFANSNLDSESFKNRKKDINSDTAIELFLKHINYILHDPKISRIRKMLTIEQFRNNEIARIQTKQSYTDVMNYFIEIIRFLISEGKLINKNPDIMAAQLCLPISAWISLCDREPTYEDQITALIEKHVKQFFEIYKAN